jgi:hypothetical protein
LWKSKSEELSKPLTKAGQRARARYLANADGFKCLPPTQVDHQNGSYFLIYV